MDIPQRWDFWILPRSGVSGTDNDNYWPMAQKNLWFGLPLLPGTPSGNGMFLGASRDFWILLVTCAARLQVIRTSLAMFPRMNIQQVSNATIFFEIPCSIGTYRNISREHLSRKVAGSCLAQNLTLVNVGAKYDEPSLLYIMNNNLDQHGGSHSDEERFLLASSGYAPFPPVISSHCVLIKVN